MDLGYDSHVALVTGGSRGIGLAIASALAAEGCRVAVTGRDAAILEQCRTQITQDASRVLCLSGDLLQDTTVANFVGNTVEQFGRIDILVNNAASFGEVELLGDDVSEWQELFSLKACGYVRMAAAAAPYLEKWGEGAILNVAGAAALRPSRDAPHAGLVNAGILNWTRLLAREMAHRRIRVNAVTPGITRTERLEHRIARRMSVTDEDRESALSVLMAQTPSGRPVEPQEIGMLSAVMCSPYATSLIGANVVVDGGLTC